MVLNNRALPSGLAAAAYPFDEHRSWWRRRRRAGGDGAIVGETSAATAIVSACIETDSHPCSRPAPSHVALRC